MGRLRQVHAQVVGLRKEEAILPSGNHFKQASLTPALEAEIKGKKLSRIAGNIFICNSSRDLWNVKGGKIVRLLGVEVDNGEKAAGPTGDPRSFLQDALDDLSF